MKRRHKINNTKNEDYGQTSPGNHVHVKPNGVYENIKSNVEDKPSDELRTATKNEMTKMRNRIGEISGRLSSNSPKQYRPSVDLGDHDKLPTIKEMSNNKSPSEMLKQIQLTLQSKLAEDRAMNAQYKKYKKNRSLYQLHGQSHLSIDSRLGKEDNEVEELERIHSNSRSPILRGRQKQSAVTLNASRVNLNLNTIEALKNDRISRYMEQKRTSRDELKTHGSISPENLRHKNYANYKPTHLNLFPSIGMVNA